MLLATYLITSMFYFFSYDVIFAAGKEEILNKFKAMEANLVISAEKTLWPDKSLEVYWLDYFHI